MKENIINVVEFVKKDTTTYTSGYDLYLEIKRNIRNSNEGQKVTLSLSGCPVMSTSFMNGVFKSLIDNLGIDKFKEVVVFTHYKPSHIEVIQKYVTLYNQHNE